MIWHYRSHESSSQKGVALLIVLLMVLAISVIGAIIYRSSTADLRLATASQIHQVLFQANDMALAAIEKDANIATHTTNPSDIDTLQGYLTRPEVAIGTEIILCVHTPSSPLFLLDKITVRHPNGDILTNANNGFCDPSNTDDYVSVGRVITQLTVKNTANTSTELSILPLSQEAESDSSNDLQNTTSATRMPCQYLTAYAVSLLPSYAKADLGNKNTTGVTTVAGCLKESINVMDKCLTALQVPHNIQIQNYLYAPNDVACFG